MTSYSKLFDVIPAKISDVEFVSSYGGTSVITSFGANGATAANVAIVKVTTDNWTNLTTAGTTLDVVLDAVQFTLPAESSFSVLRCSSNLPSRSSFTSRRNRAAQAPSIHL